MRCHIRPALGFIVTGSLLIPACMSYKQIEPANMADYNEIRITTISDHKENLQEPQLQADTLVGIRGSGDTLRIRLERIQRVEAGTTDVAKTAALVAGIAAIGAVVFVGAVAIALASEDCTLWTCD